MVGWKEVRKLATTNNPGTGLQPNMASALCYIPGIAFIVSLLFFFIEKDKTVVWNASQSLVLSVLVGVISFPLFFIAPIILLAYVCVTLFAAYKVYKGETIKLPGISVLADKLAAAKK